MLIPRIYDNTYALKYINHTGDETEGKCNVPFCRGTSFYRVDILYVVFGDTLPTINPLANH